VRDALASLSSNLDGAYDAIVKRINHQSVDDRQLALRTLSWVVHAKIPLQPVRLREALAVDSEATNLDPERQTDMDIILSVCAGLVVIDEEDDKVRLIHYTTQTYLQSFHVQTSLFPHAQSDISRTCFTYMSLIFQAFPHLLQRESHLFTHNPFLHYTVEYCLVHARGDPETRIKDSILSFLANCSIWWRLWNWKHGGRKCAPDKLQIARSFQLEVISGHLLAEHQAIIMLRDAVTRGAADEVQILAQNGVDLESNGDVLEKAVFSGHEEIVQILLAHDMIRDSPRIAGAKIRKRRRHTSSSYTMALYQAACGGADSIVEMLIQHGVDIDADCGEYGSALAGAAVAGHVSVIKRLIEHGVQINARSKYGNALQTLMHYTSIQRPKTLEVVELLVQHGVDIHASGGRFKRSALQIASEGDTTGRIIAFLLKHGTGVDTRSEEYISALREVSQMSDVSDETLRSNPRRLLQAASWLGHAALVTFLLQHHLVDAPVLQDCDKALGLASRKGHEAVIKVLLRYYGVTISGRWSAMQWALKAGHEASYKLLLDHKNAINDEPVDTFNYDSDTDTLVLPRSGLVQFSTQIF
jgi:ankyrin repeat protein